MTRPSKDDTVADALTRDLEVLAAAAELGHALLEVDRAAAVFEKARDQLESARARVNFLARKGATP